MPTTTRAQDVRARAKEQMRTGILDTARRELADGGPAGLSLRAVAREMGMASSAVYRYFDNRDALLTALIIDAYDSLGEAVETAEAAVAREDQLGRWLVIAHTVRGWALEHPSLYALVYGSPVPGYAAPQDTIGPATRVTRLLTNLLIDSMAAPGPIAFAGGPGDDAHPPLMPAAIEGLSPAVAFMGPSATPEWAAHGLMVWAWLIGTVSLEVFGQLTGTVTPGRRTEVFEAEAVRSAGWIGVASSSDDGRVVRGCDAREPSS
ncbi:MAG: TetR/AcrR family transcriptional regulator [Actinomycetota bacterium]